MTLVCETLNVYVCDVWVRACVRACMMCVHVDAVVTTFVLVHLKLSWSLFMDLLAFI